MGKEQKIPSCSCCYLIRLDKPLGNEKHSAQYYLGSCSNLKKRFEQHLKGTGSAFTRAAVEKGIAFQIVYIWRTKSKREARQLEIKLKRQKKQSTSFGKTIKERWYKKQEQNNQLTNHAISAKVKNCLKKCRNILVMKIIKNYARLPETLFGNTTTNLHVSLPYLNTTVKIKSCSIQFQDCSITITLLLIIECLQKKLKNI